MTDSEPGAGARPFPPLQQDMAELVAQGRIRYAQASATWLDDGQPVHGVRGRALRTMRREGEVETYDREGPDRSRPVRLTALGRRRAGDAQSPSE